MDLDRHILALEADGGLLAAAAGQAGLTGDAGLVAAWRDGMHVRW